MKDIADLADAITVMYGCDCRYIGSKLVKEVFQGQVAWEGEVEIFDLKDHSKTNTCYAWSYKDNKGENQYVTVLQIPPVDSAETAVKAVIANQKST